jgi:hypothetical protein
MLPGVTRVADAEEHNSADARQNNGRKNFMVTNPECTKIADQRFRKITLSRALQTTNQGVIIQAGMGKKSEFAGFL